MSNFAISTPKTQARCGIFTHIEAYLFGMIFRLSVLQSDIWRTNGGLSKPYFFVPSVRMTIYQSLFDMFARAPWRHRGRSPLFLPFVALVIARL